MWRASLAWTKSLIPGAIKPALAGALSTPLVGKIVGALTRNRVRTFGIVIDTSRREFTPTMKAEMYFNLYERQEIRFIRKYLRGASQVVELGSSLGVTSSHILDVLQPGGRLTCVEANPFLLDTLRATLSDAQRRTGREATVIHAAVWPHGEGSVTTAQLAIASSNLASQLGVLQGLEHPIRTITVPVVSLSRLVRGLTEYALVADIEGAEAALIAEEREAMSRATRVIIELHPTQYLGRAVSVSDLIYTLVSEHRFRVLDRRFRVLALAR